MAAAAMGDSTLELVKQGYQLFNEGNMPALMELYHEDTEWYIMGAPEIPFAGTFKGKEQVIDFLKNLDEAVRFSKFEVQEFITEGDKVVAIIDCEGTAKSTGKTFRTEMAHLITVREGKLYSLRDFADTRILAEALH